MDRHDNQKMDSRLQCAEYDALKKKYLRGWKTWNVNSVLSYVHMPDALTLKLSVKEYQSGHFLPDALIGQFPDPTGLNPKEVLYPGDHASDDSYTAMRVSWCGLSFLVETAQENGRLYILLTPEQMQVRPALITLQAGYLWNRPGAVRKEGDHLTAEHPAGSPEDEKNTTSFRIRCTEPLYEQDPNLPCMNPYLAILLDRPAAFWVEEVPADGQQTGGTFAEPEPADTGCAAAEPGPADTGCAAIEPTGADYAATIPAGTGRAAELTGADIAAKVPGTEDIRRIIQEKKAALRRKHQAYGHLAWMMQAMECAVTWDTVFDPGHWRVVSPVSRLWSIRSGGYVLFCWDNYFASYMAALCGNKALAYSNLIEITNEHTAKGFVPNFAWGTGQKSEDRSQPPVGAAMLLEVYRIFGEKWIVELLLPSLLAWNAWFAANRMTKSGALCWGSDPIPVRYGNIWEKEGVHERYGAALESGLDNSPMYDDIPFDPDTNMLMLEDAGLTGLFIHDCDSLIALARILGADGPIAELENRKAKAQKGLEGLWDEAFGFYCNRRTDTGTFSHRISPTNFYALFSDQVTPGRIRRILEEHYYNPHEFYGEWMLPSIARNDPAYPDQDYWRGRVWAPLNFLTYLALKQQGCEKECRDLAEKSIHIFQKEWDEHRHIHENYNSITGEGCDAKNSDKFYHWGALLSVIALMDAEML